MDLRLPSSQAASAAPSASTNRPPAIPMLDFARQFALIRDEVLAAIEEVCTSQRFILGPEVARFEAAAAQVCQVPHAIGCASGTDALWLALAAARIGSPPKGLTAFGTQASAFRTSNPDADSFQPDADGDKSPVVITTPFSFFATVSAILRAGATPLLADIDPRTYNLSPDAVAAVLASPVGHSVTAIMPVHLYGQCADMDAFARLQHQYALLLIEDAAQAFGATWNGVPAGALADAAAFSFYPTKNLSAFGDAGLVTTTSDDFAERAAMLRAHGMRRRYYHDEIGGNSRLDTLQAAVLEIKLRYLPQWNRQRQARAAHYDQLFDDAGLAAPTPLLEDDPTLAPSIRDGIILPFTDLRAGHVFHQYVIRAPRRDALRQYLTDRGIGTEIYYPHPLHLQASLAPLGYKPGDFPHAEQAAAEVLALPIYPELREDEQSAVVEAIAAFYA